MSLSHKPLAYGIRKPELKKIAQANPNLSQKDVEKIITQILEDVKKSVTKALRKWINSKVPKMTGRLRRDLLNHLRTSYVSKCVLRVYVQTSIGYALYVNRFKTSQVRHKGKRVKYRGKTFILHDFRAVGGFFDKMVIFAIKITEFHLIKIKKKYASRTRLRYIEMKIIKLW